MKTIIFALALLCTPCAAATVTLDVAFNPQTDVFYNESNGQLGVFVRPFRPDFPIASPLNNNIVLSQGDVLQVTFSGFPNFLLYDSNDVMNAFVTWGPYSSTFPVFDAQFQVLQYSGDLISTIFDPSSIFRPSDYAGGCPYPNYTGCRSDSFYKTLGIVADDGTASIESVLVTFVLLSSPGPVTIENVSFEAFSIIPGVPIPAALPLFAAGLGIVTFLARRKKTKAVSPA